MPKTITARKSNCSLWRPPFHNSWVTSWQGGAVVRSRANQSRPTDTTASVFQSRAEQKCLRANYGKKQTAGGGKVNVGRLIVSHTILPPSFWQIGCQAQCNAGAPRYQQSTAFRGLGLWIEHGLSRATRDVNCILKESTDFMDLSWMQLIACYPL